MTAISEIVNRVMERMGVKPGKISNTCSFCPEPSVSSHLIREGEIPAGWDKQPDKHPDRSHLRVVRVCTAHKDRVPR